MLSYAELRKVSIGKGDDYTTSFLLDLACLKKKKNRLIAADLSKKKRFRCRFKSNSTDYFYW